MDYIAFPSMKDAATETSHADITESTITFSTISTASSQQTLTDIKRFNRAEYNNVATETDFPAITSLTISITTTDIDVDVSSEILQEELDTGKGMMTYNKYINKKNPYVSYLRSRSWLYSLELFHF